MIMAESDEFKPRNYQVELMKIAVEKNTIIYLPTGAGKTYIAILVLKHLSTPLNIPWDDGGKVTILLVNTVALVHQHGRYIKRHTTFTVGEYTGELNVDFWDENVWAEQCRKYNVLVMTCQILTDAVEKRLIDLNRVNLLIFDECHRGVNDQPMRQLMKSFQYIQNQPRVLGLTATLLNGNCKQPARVMGLVKDLEITYHSKVATVDELKDVLGYSTNPKEKIVSYPTSTPSRVEAEAIEFLENTANVLRQIFLTGKTQPPPSSLSYLDPDKGQSELANLLTDTGIHIKMLGTYGGVQAILAHTIQIECMKKFCEDEKFYNILCAAVTSLTYIKTLLLNQLSGNVANDIYKFSSEKVRVLLNILREYKNTSKEELCGIIFVQRRFTAKVLYHLLKTLSETVDDFSFLKPNFIVGYHGNPFTDTRESLFQTKINREVIQGFFSKEYNILVSSNVLEEGIDVPTCTLVIKFDEPLDYRSYIQSKGRARHKQSLYYMMVANTDRTRYMEKYFGFQSVEEELNKYLIGQNEIRQGPQMADIQDLYDEDDIPPYYVDGPGSAQVSMVSAISLLSTYCNSFASDAYTSYAPEWYIEKHDTKFCRVVIELPIVCEYIEKIYGDYMKNRKTAKRAAALQACKILHQIGELDNYLRPIKRTDFDDEVDYLFGHWPEVKEKYTGNRKTSKIHKIQVPKCCTGPILPNEPIYLHIIHLTPYLNKSDIAVSALEDLYATDLCFGIISPKKFPTLCEFPLFVSSGELNIEIKTNARQCVFNEQDLEDIRRFNYLLYNDVLCVLKDFLVFNNVDTVLVVPVSKESEEIQFDVMRENRNLKDRFREPTREERLSLNMGETDLLNKIVTPWYRRDDTEYLVTQICYDMNAHTTFPGNYEDYMSYYKNLYQCTILNANAPLIKVKAISKAMNCIKPGGKSDKKRKEAFLNYIIHLVPELVVVQDFPSCLWLQAKLLPSIFDKVFQMLRVDELRVSIARDTGIGLLTCSSWKRLQLDKHLIKYEFDRYREDDEIESDEMVEVVNMDNISSLTYKLNKEVVSNTLQEEYPWEKCEEPIDIERNFNITLVDIYDYLKFVKTPVRTEDRLIRNSPEKQKPAITYHVDFVPRDIKILNICINRKGPELADIYKALATAKANDIVNLERLETLGDSFLKFISSVFITLKYPKYDEGKSTSLKGRIVSNKNLYYLSVRRQLSSYLKFYNLIPKEDWCPPGFCLPSVLRTRLVVTSALLSTTIPEDEQISGVLSESTINTIKNDMAENATNEEANNTAINYYLGEHTISDKFVADAAESLIGVYLESCGMPGAIKLVEWLGIIPGSVNLIELVKQPLPDPIVNVQMTQQNVDYHIPSYKELEKNLGYTFKNRAYLLQALTHSSYTPNRITRCYQRLEFLGDAVLDFLITLFIYENCENLTPGDLTDLRSALVNNITFACFTVRCGFHKHLLAINDRLQAYVDKFIRYQENKNFSINDDVLILLNEDDYHIAEYVDVPKVLGDIFESLVGAVFLDSDMNLNVVWEVFYKIMWKEIDEFRNNVPKNAVRVLYETIGAHPEFHKAVEIDDGRIMVKLDLMINGTKKRVHGFGDNKTVAKRAAAKIALRLLGR